MYGLSKIHKEDGLLGRRYQQVIVVNLILADSVADNILNSFINETGFILPFVSTYVGDSFFVVPTDKINNLVNLLNSINHRIKFTIKVEEEVNEG